MRGNYKPVGGWPHAQIAASAHPRQWPNNTGVVGHERRHEQGMTPQTTSADTFGGLRGFKGHSSPRSHKRTICLLRKDTKVECRQKAEAGANWDISFSQCIRTRLTIQTHLFRSLFLRCRDQREALNILILEHMSWGFQHIRMTPHERGTPPLAPPGEQHVSEAPRGPCQGVKRLRALCGRTDLGVHQDHHNDC